MSLEQSLPRGIGNAGAVLRAGDTVRRPVGPHTEAVQAYLRHLAANGFDGAPRALGYDEQGREVLSWIDGEVPLHDPIPEWATTDEALVSVVTLVRRLHEAARGFVAPDIAWPWAPAPEYRGGLVGHNDVCRTNVVFRDGRAVALIDFDWATPLTPAWEVAGLVGHWVYRLPGDRLRRLALVRETYPVDGLRDAMLRRCDWNIELVRRQAEAGHPGFAESWRNGAYERTQVLRAWVAEHVHG